MKEKNQDQVLPTPKAIGEWVIVECFARKPGQEETSALGIILAQKEKAIGEIPLSGNIVSIGDECKDAIKGMVGYSISLPSGRFNHVPDPLVANKTITQDNSKARIFVCMHQSAIQATYTI